jgi:monoterpene epsilon-lactone hydrolase
MISSEYGRILRVTDTENERQALDTMLRDGPLDLGGELAEQRAVMEEMMASIPLPDGVTTTETTIGGIPAVGVEVPGGRPDRVILYFHGDAYALGSARAGVPLAAEVARRARARALSLEYRLAPDHPYPAGVEDCVTAYRRLLDDGIDSKRIAIVGESAGAGLVASTLVGARRAGLSQPACAALMSPWVDLTLSGSTLETKADVDPALTADGLRRRAADYVTPAQAREASPRFDDLSGLAPALIQAGSHEILLDDALGLGQQLARCDGRVDVEIWPGVPHVFQGFGAMLADGMQALDALGAFVDRWLAAAPG